VRHRLCAGAWGALLFFASLANAEERDPVAAQALFDDARSLIRQQRYTEACPKLQESNRLDPGIGTLFHLADCFEQSGRIASAWAAFLDVASQAHASGQADREKAAAKRAERLESRLPRLRILVGEQNHPDGLEIRRNGMVVGPAQWGVAVPVDAGSVEVSASAPGRQSVRRTLTMAEGQLELFELPELALEEPAVEPSPPARPTPVAPAEPAPVVVKRAPKLAPAAAPTTEVAHSRAPWIISLAGVGAVGVGVGTVYALLAKSRYEDSKADCDRDDVNVCGPAGIAQRSEARTRGDIATVGFAAGGAALVAAGVVWLTSGSSGPVAASSRLSPAPTLAPGLAMLSMRGRF